MQLNFLAGYDYPTKPGKTTEEQYNFWDKEYNIQRIPRQPKYRNIEKFFSELDYSKVSNYNDYWRSITPLNDSQLFQRWLFAFMSVHTSWKANIIGYKAIKDWWLWMNKREDLHKLIDDSRVGMQNNRVKYISEFSHSFWKDPSSYRKDETEPWQNYRDRLKNKTLGLGPAKTSFAVEMCYPMEAKLTCLDTHMFQAYGLDQVKDLRQYSSIEQHWVDMCSMWNVPAYIARCLYWDTKQGHKDSRYWSHVFEAVNNN